MKKNLLFLFISISIGFTVNAQYVNIPDSNFRNFLQYQYPGCFNGAGQLDTTCSAIVTEDSLTLNWYQIENLQGLRYFKSLTCLDISYNSSINNIPELPATLIYFHCPNLFYLSNLPFLPDNLQYLDCSSSNHLVGLPDLPNSLRYLNCSSNGFTSLPSLPANLQYLNVTYCGQITALPTLPASLKYLDCSNVYGLTSLPSLPPLLDTLLCSFCRISNLPALPGSLKLLDCSSNDQLTTIPQLPAGLLSLQCSNLWGAISGLPALPASLKVLACSGNPIHTIPPLPSGLTTLYCSQNLLTSLPAIPGTLAVLNFYGNNIHDFPVLPNSLWSLECGGNPLHNIPFFPDSLKTLGCNSDSLSILPALPTGIVNLNCGSNQLTNLPVLPAGLKSFYCSYNQLASLPALPPQIESVSCDNNLLTSLPDLPNTLRDLSCYKNNIYCLPKLPDTIINYISIRIDPYKIACLPNHPVNVFIDRVDSMGMQVNTPLPLCNPTNNIQHCESFPVMAGTVFYDNNSNGIKDAGEPVKKYCRVSLSSNRYSFSNNNGYYEIGSDSIGPYTLSADLPTYFNAVPANYNYNFINYDTLVTNNFALQANAVVDTITIEINDGRARPGFSFPYWVSYENAGTTTISSSIVFNYDNTRLTYDSSSNGAVINNGNNLSLPVSNFVPGQQGGFIAYFTVKTTAVIGDTIPAGVTINANGNIFKDSVLTTIRGSFDPNDKQATPQLSPSQVAAGKYIDYNIRFQNTGTDTAFNIVVTDTLSGDLQENTLQMLSSSHTCKATVKDNIIFFEFLNILLPDSNVNEPKSHGFVSFRIKPQSNVAENSIIPNKAAIYFDYNAPVITNTATTEIKTPLIPVPLKLQFFSAVKQTENTVTVSWITANEINTMRFIIEQSIDGRGFTNIAYENAKGGQYNTYSRSISIPSTTVVYYRLQIIDIGGQFTYSPVVALRKNKTTGPFTILNNPVKDVLTIAVQDAGLRNTIARIITGQGAVLQSTWLQNNVETIDISKLPAGVYILQTEKGSRQFMLVR